ncbi:MAG TPA: DUF3341 domain-containing protein [Chthonomonadaceae bacterium]|nr:DUF3341 domain-containing protein [Chthonomonadaceae bacterium]
MRKERPLIYGLMAEFDTPEALLNAAKQARAAGYRRMDAFSPFAIEGLAEEVGFRFNILPWLILIGGFGGAILGYFMQWYGMAISYPINVGGRPLNSWASYVPPTFEMGVLGASLTGFFAMLALCRLPQPYHPVFTAPQFDLTTRNRFFLCLQANDPQFDARRTWQFLANLHPVHIMEVDHDPQDMVAITHRIHSEEM